MSELSIVGRLLIVAGLILVVVGILVLYGGRIPGLGWIGRLPGDFTFRRGPVTFYVPLVTSIIVSIILTLAFTLLLRR